MPEKDHAQSLIHSSEEPFYRTPPGLFRRLHAEFAFTVDAAANRISTLCPTFYGPGAVNPGQRDALQVSWGGRHPGQPHFINPPYSVKRRNALSTQGAPQIEVDVFDIAKWAGKCAIEGIYLPVVGLFPAGIQTKWWAEFVWDRAHEIRFIPHRIKFHDEGGYECEGTAGVNHAIVIWRPDPGYVGQWQPTVRYWDYR